MADQPIAKVRMYPVTASIWRNQTASGEPFYSVTFERSYKDGDVYKSSASYSGTDLLLLSKVADLAHSKTEELRNADAAAKKTPPTT